MKNDSKVEMLGQNQGNNIVQKIHRNKLIFPKARIGMFMPNSHADQQKQTVQTPARGFKNE